MIKIKNIYLYYLVFILPLIAITNCCISCNKNSQSTKSNEYILNFLKEPINIKFLDYEKENEKSNIVILVLIQNTNWEEDLLKEFTVYQSRGYIIAFLMGSWEESIITNEMEAQEFCKLIQGLFSKRHNLFLIAFDKSISFTYSLQSYKHCIEGFISVNPNIESLKSYPSIITHPVTTPFLTIITNEELDPSSFLKTLETKNRSLWEVRIYPTISQNDELLPTFPHIFEQIDLWIKTISNRYMNENN